MTDRSTTDRSADRVSDRTPDRTPDRSALPEAYASLVEPDAAIADAPERIEAGRSWLARARVGLRAQATLTLALGALLVSVAVATLTYVVARRSLVEERRSVVEQLVFSDAADVQSALAKSTSPASVIRSQDQPDLATVLFTESAVYTSNGTLSPKRIPPALRAIVGGPDAVPLDPTTASSSDGGGAATQSFAYQVVKRDGHSELIVGVPLADLRADFYGVASLRDVEDRLRSLARTLTAAALLSSLGAALVGRTVMRRVLRPLSDVASGAADISSGRLDTRLPLTGDADLDPLLASFNEMAKTLQDRIEREARFASDVSHELRTPLTALVTAARLLDGRRDELSERSQKTLDVLVMQTAHFERLVLDLLEISRFDAGAAELHAEVVHLPELIRMVIKLNGSDAVVDWQDLEPPEIGVDKRRVERMVANLLQNAANYGGGATAVRLSNAPTEPPAVGGAASGPLSGSNGTASREPVRHIRIAVDDAGPGVPEAEREVIFERFRRGQSHLRSSSAPKGTGLGLALVRAHANLHGGVVWVEDRPGGGARFVIDLAEAEVRE